MSEAGSSPSPEAGGHRPAYSIALLFLALWILLSGKIDVFHIGSGILATAYIFWQHSKMPPVERPHTRGMLIWRLIPYLAWLVLQMVLSAIYVARVIIAPKGRLDPRMIAFHRPMPSNLQSVFFGNSITLTPGTLTVDMENDCYLVHALTPTTADDLLNGEMAKRVACLSGDAEGELKEIPVSDIAPAS